MYSTQDVAFVLFIIWIVCLIYFAIKDSRSGKNTSKCYYGVDFGSGAAETIESEIEMKNGKIISIKTLAINYIKQLKFKAYFFDTNFVSEVQASCVTDAIILAKADALISGIKSDINYIKDQDNNRVYNKIDLNPMCEIVS